MPKRPLKRRRTLRELRAIRDQFLDNWTPGDPIMAHLRHLQPTIDKLVRQHSVALADIALALDMAGINYSTGKPWNAKSLANILNIIRRRLRESKTGASPKVRRPKLRAAGEHQTASAAPSPPPPARDPIAAPVQAARPSPPASAPAVNLGGEPPIPHLLPAPRTDAAPPPPSPPLQPPPQPIAPVSATPQQTGDGQTLTRPATLPGIGHWNAPQPKLSKRKPAYFPDRDPPPNPDNERE